MDSARQMADTKMANCQASRGRSLGRNIASAAPARGTSASSSSDTESKLAIIKTACRPPAYTERSHQKIARPMTPSATARA